MAGSDPSFTLDVGKLMATCDLSFLVGHRKTAGYDTSFLVGHRKMAG